MTLLSTVFVPCEVIEARATLASAALLTPLQQMMLEAVYVEQGRLKLEQLIPMFGLGHRPTLDLVNNFWQGGQIAIDPRSGALRVTAATRAHIENGTLGTFNNTEFAERSVKVLRELLTGHVIAHLDPATGVNQAHVAPAPVAPCGGRLGAHQLAELEAVVARRLRTADDRSIGWASEQQDGWHLQHVRPIVLGPDQAPARATVAVRAHVTLADESRLHVEIRHPTRILGRVRDDMAQRLASLAEEMAEHPLFRNLRERARPRAVGSVDPLVYALQRLEETCEALQAGAGGDLTSLHRASRDAGADLLARLGDTAARDERLEVLVGRVAFDAAVKQAIASASRQVVLACPWAKLSGYLRFQDELEAAVRTKRGFRLVILWGMGPGDEMDAEFARALAQLRGLGPAGAVLHCAVSARSHAKVVIADGHTALIGSANFLSGIAPDNPAELGLAMRSRDGRASHLVLDLLRWAREIAPESAVGDAIETWPVPEPDATFLDLPAEPTGVRPRDARATLDARLVAGARGQWQREWAQFVEDARRLVRGHRRGPVLMRDDDHRRALMHALRDARWRVVVASDRLSAEAFDAPAERLLRERLAGGLRVALVWQQLANKGGTAEAERALRALREEYPDRLALVVAPSHAKVLVQDDEALVTSFNFLSFEGVYEGPRSRRARKELGVHVSEPGVVDGVVAGLCAQLGDPALVTWADATVRPADAVSAGVPLRAVARASGVQSVLDQLARAESADARARVLWMTFRARRPDRPPAATEAGTANAPEPGALLEALLRVPELTDDERHTATLAALRRPETRRHPNAGRWMREVARQLWSDARYFDTAAILGLLAEELPAAYDESRPNGPATATADATAAEADLPPVPTLRVAYLGAVMESEEPFTRRLEDVLNDPATPEELDTACALAVDCLARHGWDRVADLLGQVSLPDGSVVQQLAHAYLDGWWGRSVGGPFPVAQVALVIAQRQAADRRDAALQAVREAFQRAEGYRDPDFQPGERTIHQMFGPAGRLRPLLHAVERSDSTVVQQLLNEFGDADAVVDRAWARVADRPVGLRPPRREHIVRRAADALVAAREWLVAAAEPTTAGLREDEVAAVDGLRVQLEPLRAALTVAQHREPAGPVVRRLLELFAPIFQWRGPVRLGGKGPVTADPTSNTRPDASIS